MSTKMKDVDNNLPLPSDRMPNCWNEDERMSSLFAPFRSKSANPQDWTSKYKFWKNLIYDWLDHNKRTTFSLADLNDAFKRKGCTPLCLMTVVEELVRNNEITREIEFLKEPSESWTAWSIDIFVKKPISWSFSKVKSYIVSDELDKNARYVHLQIVKEISNALLPVLEERKESVLIPFSDIVKSCRSKISDNISENTVMLALLWLRREKRVIFKTSQDQSELLIKIAVHSSDSVTEIEEGLYKLIKQESELVKEIEQMEAEKVKVIDTAKACLSKGLRQVAKTHLRKKRELENVIEKQSRNLDNIRSLISTIQNSHTNTAVLSAYRTGSNVLKKLNESGLSELNVGDIMDDLAVALEEQKEVQSMLTEPLVDNELNIDLEEELAELMKLDENPLPSVPDTSLNSSIDELEMNLKNLQVKETVASNASSKSDKSVGSKKILAQAE
ncbi:charged multivesicular body protein 7 isoform X2 [Ceratina calcarata]|nr:charged multivesicular body protein 7 isoform X2 [Ceratina calcarata]